MQQLASIASSQLEILIRRISAVVLLAVGSETLVNASFQVSASDIFPLVQISIFALFTFLAVLSLWFDLGSAWVTIHGLVVLSLVWLAPISINSVEILGSEGRPWIWWAIGLSAILVGVFSPRLFSLGFIPAVSASWFIIEVSILGEARLLQATLDSAYFVVFALAILGLVGLVRQGASEVDIANTAAIVSSIERAKLEAIERERQRIDALVHDQVLHTLLIAAKATSESEFALAKTSASNAIKSLEVAATDTGQPESVAISGLVRAIASSSEGLDPRVKVEINQESSLTLPSQVAQAITEAAMQALDNSIQHSAASSIIFRIQATDTGVLFEILDDGSGFRLDRVSKDRIGIRTSITYRMQSVGGKATIDSKPGNGTSVKLEWPID